MVLASHFKFDWGFGMLFNGRAMEVCGDSAITKVWGGSPATITARTHSQATAICMNHEQGATRRCVCSVCPSRTTSACLATPSPSYRCCCLFPAPPRALAAKSVMYSISKQFIFVYHFFRVSSESSRAILLCGWQRASLSGWRDLSSLKLDNSYHIYDKKHLVC